MSRQKYVTTYSSNLRQGDAARMAADAAALVKAKLEFDSELDPRGGISDGELAARCRGLELRSQIHGVISTGVESLNIVGVEARETIKDGAPWIYLGHELRRANGEIVAQRLRSPESSVLFKKAMAAKDERAKNAKESNLFLANWTDPAVVDARIARQAAVGRLQWDMTAGIAHRLSFYSDSHRMGPGHVDLREAMPFICRELDAKDAEAAAAKAKIEAVRVEVAQELEGVANPTLELLRMEARQLGLKGVSKLKKQELLQVINAATLGGPPEVIVTAEESEAINSARNAITLDGGQGRLRAALKAAGIIVPVIDGDPVGAWQGRALAAAKACRAGKEVASVKEAVEGMIASPVTDEAVIVTG